MAASLEDVIKRIEDSGILDDVELSAVREDAQAVDGDAQKFVRLLVKKERLTAYQAQAIWKDKGHKLSFGNYLVESELGRGGMGVVLKARHKRMKRHVAIKVLPAKMTSNKDAIARFQREVEAAAQLSHTNIVGAHDADEIDGQHFLVMEFVDGRDLSSVIKGNGPLPIEQAVACVIQAARGLEFAHQRGVIHRDIKPANLLLDNEGTVKILDMGLARFSDSADVDTQAELTGTGTVMGTVDYMSPEQALNTKTADARSDIYSLGITLYYLLVARPAYEGDTMMARLLAHANQPIPSLRDSRPDVAEPIQTIFETMVAKQADDRYQSMTDVVAALERSQGDGANTSVNVDQLQSQPEGPAGPSELSNMLVSSAPTVDELPVTTPPQVDNHGPTVITPASANGAVAATVVTPPAPADPGMPTINTDAPTIVTSSLSNTIQSGTIQNSGGASSPSGRPAWMSDKRILGGISGGVLLLIVIAALAFKSDPSDNQVASTGKTKLKTSVTPTDHTRPREEGGTSTVAQAPVDPEFALEFDGDDYVSVSIPDVPIGDEYTVEAWVAIKERPDKDNYTGVILNWANVSNVLLKRFRVGDKANVVTASHHMEQGYFTASAAPFPGRKHVAFVYRDQKISLFVDGKWTKKTRHDRNAGHRYSGPPVLTIGAEGKGEQNFFTGRIDEVRVSSVARYEDDFPPEQRFNTDDDTLAHYHFDEGQGDVLKDSSGNGHHGKIVGAKWVSIGRTKSSARAVAEWILANGGSVGTGKKVWFTNANYHIIKHVDDLPEDLGLIKVVDMPIRNQAMADRLPDLARFKNLESLLIYVERDAGSADLAEIGSLPGLSAIRFGGHVNSGNLKYLAEMPAIRTLSLIGRWFEDKHLAHIKDMRNLEMLGLEESALDGSGLSSLQNLKNMKVLYFRASQHMGDYGLEHIRQLPLLESVMCQGVALTDAGLRQLEVLKTLKQIDLTGTKVTLHGMTRFKQALPDCRIKLGTGDFDLPDPEKATAPPPAVVPFDTAQAKAHQQAWADYLGEPVETMNSIGMKLAVIPPGSFKMGEGDNVVNVTLTKPFRLGIHEVTQGQWKTVMETEPWGGAETRTRGKERPRDLRELDRCHGVLPQADRAGARSWEAPGRLGVPAADGCGMGVGVPVGHNDNVLVRRRRVAAGGVRLVRNEHE